MTKVALITGCARRIGAEIATVLHQSGLNIIIHYHRSEREALALFEKFNQLRPNSAKLIAFDLRDTADFQALAAQVVAAFGRLDILVNNASTFYPTESVTETQWQDLMGVNLKAPYFLIQSLTAELIKNAGSIVNITDVNAAKAKLNYEVYCIAKAGLVALTQQMANRLAPAVRVNAVAPSLTLPPEGRAAIPAEKYQEMLSHTPFKRKAEPIDIAQAVKFLALDTSQITGQVLKFDIF